eukprot:Nk52_evm7s2462 gene=Nk52_evmTU7s2462
MDSNYIIHVFVLLSGLQHLQLSNPSWNLHCSSEGWLAKFQWNDNVLRQGNISKSDMGESMYKGTLPHSEWHAQQQQQTQQNAQEHPTQQMAQPMNYTMLQATIRKQLTENGYPNDYIESYLQKHKRNYLNQCRMAEIQRKRMTQQLANQEKLRKQEQFNENKRRLSEMGVSQDVQSPELVQYMGPNGQILGGSNLSCESSIVESSNRCQPDVNSFLEKLAVQGYQCGKRIPEIQEIMVLQLQGHGFGYNNAYKTVSSFSASYNWQTGNANATPTFACQGSEVGNSAGGACAQNASLSTFDSSQPFGQQTNMRPSVERHSNAQHVQEDQSCCAGENLKEPVYNGSKVAPMDEKIANSISGCNAFGISEGFENVDITSAVSHKPNTFTPEETISIDFNKGPSSKESATAQPISGQNFNMNQFVHVSPAQRNMLNNVEQSEASTQGVNSFESSSGGLQGLRCNGSKDNLQASSNDEFGDFEGFYGPTKAASADRGSNIPSSESKEEDEFGDFTGFESCVTQGSSPQTSQITFPAPPSIPPQPISVQKGVSGSRRPSSTLEFGAKLKEFVKNAEAAEYLPGPFVLPKPSYSSPPRKSSAELHSFNDGPKKCHSQAQKPQCHLDDNWLSAKRKESIASCSRDGKQANPGPIVEETGSSLSMSTHWPSLHKNENIEIGSLKMEDPGRESGSPSSHDKYAAFAEIRVMSNTGSDLKDTVPMVQSRDACGPTLEGSTATTKTPDSSGLGLTSAVVFTDLPNDEFGDFESVTVDPSGANKEDVFGGLSRGASVTTEFVKEGILGNFGDGKVVATNLGEENASEDFAKLGSSPLHDQRKKKLRDFSEGELVSSNALKANDFLGGSQTEAPSKNALKESEVFAKFANICSTTQDSAKNVDVVEREGQTTAHPSGIPKKDAFNESTNMSNRSSKELEEDFGEFTSFDTKLKSPQVVHRDSEAFTNKGGGIVENALVASGQAGNDDLLGGLSLTSGQSMEEDSSKTDAIQNLKAPSLGENISNMSANHPSIFHAPNVDMGFFDSFGTEAQPEISRKNVAGSRVEDDLSCITFDSVPMDIGPKCFDNLEQSIENRTVQNDITEAMDISKIFSCLIKEERLSEAISCEEHLKNERKCSKGEMEAWSSLQCEKVPLSFPISFFPKALSMLFSQEIVDKFISEYDGKEFYSLIEQSKLQEALAIQQRVRGTFMEKVGNLIDDEMDLSRVMCFLQSIVMLHNFNDVVSAKLLRVEDSQREEIIQSSTFLDYLCSLKEVYVMCCRLYVGCSERIVALEYCFTYMKDTWLHFLKRICCVGLLLEGDLDTIVNVGNFKSRAKDTESKCSICLYPVDNGWDPTGEADQGNDFFTYENHAVVCKNEKLYHCPCLNFWLKNIEADLP